MLTGKNAQPLGKLPPDRRKRGFSFARSVGAHIPKLTSKVFEKHGFHSGEIMTEWARIAGSDIAAWTAPERIRWPRANGETEDGASGRPGGTLTLRVEPARALDVEYRSGEIIDRINRYFGYRAVATLKLIQAPLKEQSLAPPPAPSYRATVPQQSAPLPENDALAPDLRNALARLWDSVSKASGR